MSQKLSQADVTQQPGFPVVGVPPEPVAIPRVFDALKIRNFRLFIFGAFVSNLGTWLQAVALSWLILELTGSAFWVAMVPFAQFAPMLVLGLFGGVAADRFERRRILFMTQTIMLLSASGMTAVTWSGRASLLTLMPLVAMGGVALAFNAPAFQAFISDLVPRTHVPVAVSVNSSQFSLSRVLGPAIAGYILAAGGAAGGYLIAVSGATLAFAINSLTFLAVLGALALIRVEPHERSSKIGRQSFMVAFKTAKEIPVIKSLLVVAIGTSLLSAPVVALLPVVAKTVMGRGAASYGQLFSAFGLGAAAGSLLSARFTARVGFSRLVIGASAMQALLLGAFIAASWFPLSLVILGMFGALHAGIIASTSSGLQMVTPSRRRGRVMSLFLMAFAGLYPVGALIAGIASDRVGAQLTLGLTAGAIGFLSLVYLRLSSRFAAVSHT